MSPSILPVQSPQIVSTEKEPAGTQNLPHGYLNQMGHYYHEEPGWIQITQLCSRDSYQLAMQSVSSHFSHPKKMAPPLSMTEFSGPVYHY